MKIAIMMRAMDQDSGHRAIVDGLVSNMLRIDQKNSYLLLYRTDKWFRKFAGLSNVTERLVSAPHKLLWDQVAVPYAAWKENADVIYNPKFSVPLISPCPVVMGLHEPAWWVWPQHYEWLDRNYMRLMLPLYVRKSAQLFPISNFVVNENRKYLRLPLERTTVVYPAPKDYFRCIDDRAALDKIREDYQLPQKFILAVTRVDHAGLDRSASFFPGKNVETTVRAFVKCRRKIPHRLVIAGRNVREYLLKSGITPNELEGIVFLGFVSHEDLPTLLTLADLFVLSSFYESYAMALVEAMACGCAIVASETGACPEITAGAGLLADPYDSDDFAERMLQVLTDNDLKQRLQTKSLQRAAFFDWGRSAKQVLGKLEEVVAGRCQPTKRQIS